MHDQQFRNTSVSIRLRLNSFLTLIDYNNIYLLPYNNNSQILAAAQSRNNNRNIRRLTGKILLKRNIEREAHRLQIHDRHLINLAVNYIWYLNSTLTQRRRFTNLANEAKNLNQNRVSQIHLRNNTNTLNRITQLTIPQVSNDPFEFLFNGSNFSANNDNNNLESLILPSGWFSESSSFP